MSRFKRSKGIFKKLDNDTSDRLELVGAFVATAAKLFAAVDTGKMRSTIYHEVIDSGKAVRVGASAEYSVFVEFGTRFAPAQPFLFPAVANNKNSILSIMGGR